MMQPIVALKYAFLRLIPQVFPYFYVACGQEQHPSDAAQGSYMAL